jgi:hypothetical protein
MLSQVEFKPTDSPFWKGLMKVKDDFFAHGFFEIGKGNQTRFLRRMFGLGIDLLPLNTLLFTMWLDAKIWLLLKQLI